MHGRADAAPRVSVPAHLIGHPVVRVASFMALFVALGWFGSVLGFPHSPLLVYYPAVGLAAGVVARTAGRARLAFLAATFAASIVVRSSVLGTTPAGGALIGAANTAEVLVFAVIVDRWLRVGQLATVADTVRFLTAALVTATVGGVLASPALAVLGGDVPFGQSWPIRVLSHLIGLIVVGSVVLAWAALRTRWTARILLDLVAWAALLAVVTQVGFSGAGSSIAFPYMPLAVVLFAAVRLGAPAAAVLLQLLVPAALWFSAHGYGPFARMALGTSAEVVAAQLFCLTAAATCWLVAARNSERECAAERLAAVNSQLEQANCELVAVNAQLVGANTELEHRVAVRTADLERAAAGSALTARVAQALAEARLDPESTLQAVARTLTGLGDLCVVTQLTTARDAIQPVAVAAVTDDLARAAEEIWLPLRLPLPLDASAGNTGLSGRALSTGRAVRGGGTPKLLSEISHPALPPLLTRFGLHSALVAPMHADGQVVGTLVVVRGGRRPAFDAEEERVVQDLADRAGLAVQNALLHQELADRALTDPLTSLPNRHLLLEQLALALRRLERHPGTVAVVFVDLDDFKAVNDDLGHDTGDKLLIHVAARLRAALRAGDIAARLGGDEFVAVCPDLADTAAARAIAERLALAIATPLPLNGHTLHPRASVGVATTDDPLTDPEQLLHHADTAMYESKRRGHAGVHVHGEDLDRSERCRLEIQELLHAALAGGWLRLVYQPIVDLRTGTITAVEALLRVDHPHRGLLTPADFIDVAESTDLIIAMEEWALPEACAQLTRWHRHRAVELSVNMSGRHISLPGAADRLLQTLAAAGVAPHTLCVELTERVLINAEAATLTNLETLRLAGVRLALDDFGTGYSPLTYLQVLPIDTVKIDRSFTAGLGTTTRSHAIVAALTALGRALGMRMIAEGVETGIQLTQLRELRCDLAQGYYLHRPTDTATIAELLRSDAAGRRTSSREE